MFHLKSLSAVGFYMVLAYLAAACIGFSLACIPLPNCRSSSPVFLLSYLYPVSLFFQRPKAGCSTAIFQKRIAPKCLALSRHSGFSSNGHVAGFFLGSPGFLSASQIDSPLKGYAPIFSVYGVSLATVLSAALLVSALDHARKKQALAAYLNLLIVVIIWVQGSLLNWVPWTKPEGQPFQVSMVQANIPQQLKWLPEQVLPTLLRYKNLSQPHWDSQVVIWPEGAIPAPLEDVTGFVDEMSNIATSHHAQLIAGIPVKNINNNRYFNAVISVGYDGVGYYLKHRLVPFGEFIPFEHWLGRLFDLLKVPMSDFTPDSGFPEPLLLQNHIKMLAFICYEIAYPEQVLHTLKEVGLLLTVTNDAWYGHSIAQAQHLQMAQMRALENGRPLLFASNNGITAIISNQGRLLSVAPPFETYVLTGRVQAYTGKTPWQRYAMDPILLILLSLLIVAVKYRRT